MSIRLRDITTETKDQYIFLLPMTPYESIMGVLKYKTSGSASNIVPCKISEKRYKLKDNYKITLEGIVGYKEIFGHEHYYISDLQNMINDGIVQVGYLEDNDKITAQDILACDLSADIAIKNKADIVLTIRSNDNRTVDIFLNQADAEKTVTLLQTSIKESLKVFNVIKDYEETMDKIHEEHFPKTIKDNIKELIIRARRYFTSKQ